MTDPRHRATLQSAKNDAESLTPRTMASPALRRLFGGFRAQYHFWIGRRAYRAGRLHTAGRHLDKALARGNSSFSAYLLMAKVAYRGQDMPRALDCFRQARLVDPARYALEGFPKGFLESLGRQSQSQEAAQHRFRIVIEPARPSSRRQPARPTQGAGRLTAQPERTQDSAAQPEKQTLGDFSSREERDRARGRPLLRPGEWADIDWDVEARKLFGD
jgi:hypothetical protein